MTRLKKLDRKKFWKKIHGNRIYAGEVFLFVFFFVSPPQLLKYSSIVPDYLHSFL